MFKSISSWVKTVLNVKQLFIIGMTGCIIQYCRSSYSKIFELLLFFFSVSFLILLLFLLWFCLFFCFVLFFGFVFLSLLACDH